MKSESKPIKSIAILPKKEESQKTLVEIIEDARSGLPSKSELDKRIQKEALRKLGGSVPGSKVGT